MVPEYALQATLVHDRVTSLLVTWQRDVLAMQVGATRGEGGGGGGGGQSRFDDVFLMIIEIGTFRVTLLQALY